MMSNTINVLRFFQKPLAPEIYLTMSSRPSGGGAASVEAARAAAKAVGAERDVSVPPISCIFHNIYILFSRQG